MSTFQFATLTGILVYIFLASGPESLPLQDLIYYTNPTWESKQF